MEQAGAELAPGGEAGCIPRRTLRYLVAPGGLCEAGTWVCAF